MSSTGGWRNW